MANLEKKLKNNSDTTQPKIKLSTEAYKGVRDFFPEDMAVEKAIFCIWRDAAEKYGYEEYAASVLEPAELYKAKSGDEIVNEQTYTFHDRGDREVTLRPEMTPTVARMVAAKRRGLSFPLRWYSIPNLFRYENPQRGRLREHWQLNVDIFGVDGVAAEIEIIAMAADITRAYGLADHNFTIRLNSRELTEHIMRNVFGLDEIAAHELSRLIDKKEKMPRERFLAALDDIFNDEKSAALCVELLESDSMAKCAGMPGMDDILNVMAGLDKLGVKNVTFDPTLMRGFDYYTGMVFEIFDLDPNNRRSVFGGGRYDDLLSLFGSETVSAVGFGAGDVVARDLMETYGKLDTIVIAHAPADLAICLIEKEGEHSVRDYAFILAHGLRDLNIRVAVNFSNKKTGDKIAAADKRHIPFVIILGEEELKSGEVVIKKLSTKEEKLFPAAEFTKMAAHVCAS